MLIGLRAHVQDERTTGGEVGIIEPRTIVRLPIQFGMLDINVPRGMVDRLHREDVAAGIDAVEVDRRFCKHGTRDLETIVAWAQGVKPDGRENIPCRHLSDIIIAD